MHCAKEDPNINAEHLSARSFITAADMKFCVLICAKLYYICVRHTNRLPWKPSYDTLTTSHSHALTLSVNDAYLTFIRCFHFEYTILHCVHCHIVLCRLQLCCFECIPFIIDVLRNIILFMFLMQKSKYINLFSIFITKRHYRSSDQCGQCVMLLYSAVPSGPACGSNWRWPNSLYFGCSFFSFTPKSMTSCAARSCFSGGTITLNVPIKAMLMLFRL